MYVCVLGGGGGATVELYREILAVLLIDSLPMRAHQGSHEEVFTSSYLSLQNTCIKIFKDNI